MSAASLMKWGSVHVTSSILRRVSQTGKGVCSGERQREAARRSPAERKGLIIKRRIGKPPDFTRTFLPLKLEGDFWEVRRAGERACLYAFDLLRLDGQDLRRNPLEARKARLKRLLGRRKRILHYVDHIAGDGARVFKHACALGLEGIVSKRRTCPINPSGGSRCHSQSNCRHSRDARFSTKMRTRRGLRRDRHGSNLDEDGVEVADMGQLRAHAQKAVEELRSADPSAARDWKGWRLEVTDTSGAVLLTINLNPDPLRTRQPHLRSS
jgi:hypothetical protein